MRVKMLTTMAGPAGSHQAGATADLPTKQAKALVDGGYAEAVVAAPETAADPGKRKRRKKTAAA